MIKKIIKKVIPLKFLNNIINIKNKFSRYTNFRLYLTSNTVINNTKNRYLIIKDSCQGVGPLSGWFHYMTLVNFAIHNNYLPVLDFKNCYMPVFMDINRDSTTNFWDVYFCQPSPIDNIEEAYSSTHIVVDYYKLSQEKPEVFSFFSKYALFKHSNNDFLAQISKSDLNECHKFWKLCPISHNLIQKAETFFYSNTNKNEKILGVSFNRVYERLHIVGSKWTPPGTHPVKCTLQQLVNEIEKALKITGADRFLFVVDDRETLDFIIEKFGNKCFYYPRPLRHLFENGQVVNSDNEEKLQKLLNTEFLQLPHPIEERNKDYLIEVYLLSLCDYFLSRGGSSDTFAYIIKKGKFIKTF